MPSLSFQITECTGLKKRHEETSCFEIAKKGLFSFYRPGIHDAPVLRPILSLPVELVIASLNDLALTICYAVGSLVSIFDNFIPSLCAGRIKNEDEESAGQLFLSFLYFGGSALLHGVLAPIAALLLIPAALINVAVTLTDECCCAPSYEII